MKSLKLKVEKVMSAYRVLNEAKYQKLSDGDKVKVWKITRLLKPIATQCEEDIVDARQKMMPDKDFAENIQKAEQYERMMKNNQTEGLPLTSEEYLEIAKKFKEYSDLLTKALKEPLEKEVELEIDTIGEDAFGKLMSSNDWNFSQVSDIEFMME